MAMGMKTRAAGKVGEMNRAHAEIPRTGRGSPAGPKGQRPKSPMAGSETKAQVKATQDGGNFASAAKNPLKGAKAEMSREYSGKRSH